MRDCDVAAEHVPNKLKVENTPSSRRKRDETPLHLLQLMGNMVLFLRNTTRVRNIPTFVGHDHTIKLNVTMFPKNAISNTLNEVSWPKDKWCLSCDEHCDRRGACGLS